MSWLEFRINMNSWFQRVGRYFNTLWEAIKGRKFLNEIFALKKRVKIMRQVVDELNANEAVLVLNDTIVGKSFFLSNKRLILIDSQIKDCQIRGKNSQDAALCVDGYNVHISNNNIVMEEDRETT